jgi:hypothetical protein
MLTDVLGFVYCHVCRRLPLLLLVLPTLLLLLPA